MGDEDQAERLEQPRLARRRLPGEDEAVLPPVRLVRRAAHDVPLQDGRVDGVLGADVVREGGPLPPADAVQRARLGFPLTFGGTAVRRTPPTV